MIHDPYSQTYRAPVGAVKAGTQVTLRASLQAEPFGCCCLLLIHPDGRTEQLPMKRTGALFSASFPCTQTGLLRYAFYSEKDGGCCYGPEGETAGQSPASLWSLTVYEPGFVTPRWFSESICYQIFPDRFRRSACAPTEKAAREYTEKKRSVYLHTSWEEEPLYAAREGKEEYVPDDYFGGDLKGIEEKLPYLASLGIGSLYLNPIFEADSNHRYNTADYLRIDPFLGTEADFASLVKTAETHGIHILLDGVFSHTGADSRYFDIKGTYKGGAYTDQNSPYASWYRFERWPDAYECWWGFKTLPNVEETDPKYGTFIHGEGGVLAHWQGAGAKGWRLDVADELPEAFIRALRVRVKREDPEAVLLGEVWEDAAEKMGPEGRRTYVDGQELDGCMNYPLRRAILQYLNGETDAYACEQALWSLYTHYPRPFYEACLNLLSSHDEVRALTYLSGAPDRNALDREGQAAFVPTEAALARGKRLFACATALQMVLPGVPCIYYGDEAGLTGMADPFNRRTYPWGREDSTLQDTVARLCALRNGSRVLKNGAGFKMGALTPHVFAVLRFTKSEAALLLINRGELPRTVNFYPSLLSHGMDGLTPVALAGVYRDAFTGEEFTAHATLRIGVEGNSFRLLLKTEANALQNEAD